MDGMESILGQPVNAMSNFMNPNKMDRNEDLGTLSGFEQFGNQGDSINSLMNGFGNSDMNFSMPMNGMMMNQIGTPLDSGSMGMGGDMNVNMNSLHSVMDSPMNLDIGGVSGGMSTMDENVANRSMSNIDMMSMNNHMDNQMMPSNMNMMNNQYGGDDAQFPQQINGGMPMNRGPLDLDHNMALGPNMRHNMGAMGNNIPGNMFGGSNQYGAQFNNFGSGGRPGQLNSPGIPPNSQLNASAGANKRSNLPVKKRQISQRVAPKKAFKAIKGTNKQLGSAPTQQTVISGPEVNPSLGSRPQFEPVLDLIPPTSTGIPSNDIDGKAQSSVRPPNNLPQNNTSQSSVRQSSQNSISQSGSTQDTYQSVTPSQPNTHSDSLNSNGTSANAPASSHLPLRQFEFNKQHPPPPRALGALRLRIQFILTLNQELIKVSMSSASGSNVFVTAMSRLESNLRYLQQIFCQSDISAAFSVSPPPFDAVQEIPSLTEPYKKLGDMFQFRGIN